MRGATRRRRTVAAAGGVERRRLHRRRPVGRGDGPSAPVAAVSALMATLHAPGRSAVRDRAPVPHRARDAAARAACGAIRAAATGGRRTAPAAQRAPTERHRTRRNTGSRADAPLEVGSTARGGGERQAAPRARHARWCHTRRSDRARMIDAATDDAAAASRRARRAFAARAHSPRA